MSNKIYVFVQFSTLIVIFENMMSFTPIFNQELEQGKLMVALHVDPQK